MSKTSGTKVLRDYLEDHVGEEIPLSKLNEICAEVGLHHWDRTLRMLQQQEGLDIENQRGKWYKLRSLDRLEVKAKRGNISKKLRYMVFERDNYTCRACGKTPKKDGVKLSPDHIIPVEWGGETNLDNLQALCRECNEGKQAWVTGEDAEIMKRVSQQTNTGDRLRIYFLNHPNEEIDVDRLAVVAKTREWTRQLRKLRPEYGMKIEFRRKNNIRKKDTYIYLED